MARTVERLVTEQHFHDFARISVNAYPMMSSVEDVQQRMLKIAQEDEPSSYWGVFEDGVLLGGMRLLDFQMNYHGQLLPAGGIGSVAVDLVHKKRKVARDLITFALDQFEAKGETLAMLYPFRPDFYHQMGFGYGPKMHQYRFSPGALADLGSRSQVVQLTQEEDQELLRQFLDDYARAQHGFCLKSPFELRTMFERSPNRFVGFKKDGRLHGYVRFGFKSAHEANFVKNDMQVWEWLWDGPEALAALTSFLRRQADQVNRVLLITQGDAFHYLLDDPRNGTDNLIPSVYHEAHTTGVGLMYRVLSLPRLLEATSQRNFNGVSARLAVHVRDTFRPGNGGLYRLEFREGRAAVLDHVAPAEGGAASDPAFLPTAGQAASGEVALSLDVAEFSALLMGSVDAVGLYRNGRLQTDPADLPLLQRLFRAEQAPECMSHF